MIEFALVDHPAIKPQRCVTCLSSTGPLVDTFVEQWGDRIYVCVACVKRAARVAGFVKGAKLDQLSHALDEQQAKQAEIDGLTEQLRDLRGKLGNEQRRVAQTQSMLEDALNRERTRAHLAAEIAGAAAQLQTVGEPVLESVA